MAKHEYYNIDLSLIPQHFIDKYNLIDKQINVFLYIRAEMGIYCLVQAGITAHTELKEHLQPFGYEPVPITSGLWRHNKNGINFTLVFDNYWIKYHWKEEALHVIHALKEKYEITQDWTGSLYSGTTLNWEYKAGILEISMSRYLKESLQNFQHPTLIRPHNPLHKWNPTNYGSTEPQLELKAPEYPKLSPPEANTLQQVVGTFLYYLRSVNTTTLVSLNRISAENPTAQKTSTKQSLIC